MSKILITGARGQLGSELYRQLGGESSSLGEVPIEYREAELLAPTHGEFDLADPFAMEAYWNKKRPDVVFHCAAYSNVEGCEEAEGPAYLVNSEGTRSIAKLSNRYQSKMIYISTDYVFAGDKQSPYVETDECQPLSIYGKSKLLGEQYTLEYCPNAFIVRTSWLYGFHGTNFVKTILRKARTERDIFVVQDQVGTPTNAKDLACCLLQLSATGQYGIYHCSGMGACSWYEFAHKIVQFSEENCTVHPCTTREGPYKARRPAYSVMSNAKIQDVLAMGLRTWQDALLDFLGGYGGKG